jgi:hypothetical protein
LHVFTLKKLVTVPSKDAERTKYLMCSNAECQILICLACGEEFVFTAEAQEFFEQRGIDGAPKWCRSCFVERKRAGRRLHGRNDSSEKSGD